MEVVKWDECLTITLGEIVDMWLEERGKEE